VASPRSPTTTRGGDAAAGDDEPADVDAGGDAAIVDTLKTPPAPPAVRAEPDDTGAVADRDDAPAPAPVEANGHIPDGADAEAADWSR